MAQSIAGANCLLCHTVDRAISAAAVADGASWTCERCGQHWDAGRLAAVVAYQSWMELPAATGAISVTQS
jgi:hypothetical protein